MTPTERLTGRIERNARTLTRLYPELFPATIRGQAAREKNSSNRADPPGPAREDVIDLIREVNAACLELEVRAKNTLGMHVDGPLDVRYRQSPKVPDALRFLDRAAPALATRHPGFAGETADWLQALAATARRLLGLSSKAIPLGVDCPVVDLDLLAGDGVCDGTLVGLPQAGVVVCHTCDTRWVHDDWVALGRTVTPTAAAVPVEAAA
jgi:hypothetical protein